MKTITIPAKTVQDITITHTSGTEEDMQINIGKEATANIKEMYPMEGTIKGTITIHVEANGKGIHQELIRRSKIQTEVNKVIHCGKNSTYQRDFIWGGTTHSKNKTEFMVNEGASILDREILLGDINERAEVTTSVIHKGKRSTADVSIRGVARKNAICNVRGVLRVEPEATEVKTELKEQMLLLSAEATAKAVPALEILNNNVQARHAASVTHLDDEKKFYLASKGLSENEAERVLIDGFLNTVIEKTTEETQKIWAQWRTQHE